MPKYNNSVTLRLTPQMVAKLSQRVASKGTNQHAVLLAALHVGLESSEESLEAGASAIKAERLATDKRIHRKAS